MVVDLCHENKRNVFSPMHNDSFVTIINIVNLEKQLCLSMSKSNLKSCYLTSQEIYVKHLIFLIYFRRISMRCP